MAIPVVFKSEPGGSSFKIRVGMCYQALLLKTLRQCVVSSKDQGTNTSTAQGAGLGFDLGSQ